MIRILAFVALIALLAAPVFAQGTFTWEPAALFLVVDNEDLDANFDILITNTTGEDRTYVLEFTELPQPTWATDNYTRSWCTHGSCAYYGIALVTDELAAGTSDPDCHVQMGWEYPQISDTTIYVATRAYDQEFPNDYVETTFALYIGATDVDDGNSAQPMTYSLAPVYPNPFNAQATVNFTLPSPQNTVIALFDVNGRQVSTVAEGFYQAGSHQLTISAQNFASGTYFIRMLAGEQQFSQRITMIK